MATHNELGAVMAVLTAAYPMLTLGKPTFDIYEQELADVPVQFLLEAAYQHVKRCRFFPTIAELRGGYDEQRQGELRAEKNRQWKANLEQWRRESLPAGEARKLLTNVIDAASKHKGTEIVPFRGRGLRRVLAEKPKDYELGASASDEEFERRRRRAKEGA